MHASLAPRASGGCQCNDDIQFHGQLEKQISSYRTNAGLDLSVVSGSSEGGQPQWHAAKLLQIFEKQPSRLVR
jgi:hypothetical protein